MLKDIRDEGKNVHILYADSSLIEMFVYDTLKDVCAANLESIITVESTSGLNDMVDLVNINPFLARKWLFVIDYKKVKKQVLKMKNMFLGSDTSCFLFKVSNYKEFKELRDTFGAGVANDMYLAYMSYKDVTWLLQGYELPQGLVDYVAKSYSRDPEKIMILIKEMNNGLHISDKRGIVDVCGESTGSIISFVLSLLNIKISSKKGMKLSIAKKSKEAISLARLYGSSSFRNFVLATLKDIIYIKEMYLNGDIYDTIRDVPDCFDEKRLLRYKVYLRSIIVLNMSDVTRLYVLIAKSGSWHQEIDVMSFLYDYYEKEVVL